MTSKIFRAVVLSAAILGTATGFTAPAWSDGAIAVGITANVQKDGFAYGMVVDKSSEATARREAIEACRTGPGSGSKEIRSLCRVVGVIKDQCVSLAWDPGDGTPGVGWAIAFGKDSAEEDALGMCRATAGPRRRDKCVIAGTRCDGN